jgi:hypothetical protein
MICRTGVQDRLKIRLDALVELPFKIPVRCYALVRSPPTSAACHPIERFGDIIAYPILGGLHHRYART